ncbi:MAG: RnfABCDGE type electron transport complex subunit B [Burkholderiales bacterium]|nr:MAG: RnfABCDGE type electron transport complex subunit B [Burkholderiales bacterium]
MSPAPGSLAAHGAQNPLVARLHAALPQTQCTRCGYPDCAAYAQAIAGGEAGINQCPPGGAEGIARLAAITGQAILPLNPANGAETPRSVAVIDEAWCIGCTLCIKVCPTDAILGSNKHMHTVIEPYCTGCELCLPVCPVDCILMENVTGERTGWQAWSPDQADEALERYKFHSARGPLDEHSGPISHENTGEVTAGDPENGESAETLRKRAVIEAALARARANRR